MDKLSQKVYILISFDHELSLGGARSYSKNMFDPSEEILHLANELQVPITFFTDILCALKFREWDYANFYEPYCKQIEKTVRLGHDVQLHLHPHWIESEMEDGQFVPSKKFGLGDFLNDNPPNNIPGIVGKGINLLTDICRSADSNYKCIAYRAGGYNLYPHTQEILRSLYEHGIRIESSIAKGFYFSSGVSKVNFRNMPDQANWTIPIEGPLDAIGATGLLEVPIASRPRNTLNNIPFLIKRVLHRKRSFDSGGWGIHNSNTGKLEKLSRLFPNSAWMLGFDDFANNVSDLKKILYHHLRIHQRDDIVIASIISHPKSMGPYNLLLMKEFVENIKDEYGGQVEFCTYRNIYDKFI